MTPNPTAPDSEALLPVVPEVEAVARLLIKQRGVNPDSLYQHDEWDKLPTDERIDRPDPFTGEPRVILMHRAWRKRVKDAEEILAAIAPRATGEAQRCDGEVDYEVWQADAFGDGDAMVAGSTSLADAQHYAAVYEQDGPAWVVEVTRKRLTALSDRGEGI